MELRARIRALSACTQRIGRMGWTARRRRPGVDPSGCANGAELESALS